MAHLVYNFYIIVKSCPDPSGTKNQKTKLDQKNIANGQRLTKKYVIMSYEKKIIKK